MKYIFFFATVSDMSPVLELLETNAPLKFVQTGMFSTPNLPIYLTSHELPKLGQSTADSGTFSTTYMVSHRDTKNHVYAFTDDTGERRWLLSNGDNEETTLLTPAGLWTTGTLLPGNMSTMHNTPVAQQLMRWFLSALKTQGYVKIETWWLGREALEMLKSGHRLAVASEESPPDFDLKWPSDEGRSLAGA